MPALQWFNENMHRDYPFLQGSTSRAALGAGNSLTNLSLLPMEVVVDLQIVIGPQAGFDWTGAQYASTSLFVAGEDDYADRHSVWLAAIANTVDGEEWEFVFESDCPALAGRPLVFVALNNSMYTAGPVTIRSNSPVDACGNFLWQGTLSLGNFSEVVAHLNSSATASGQLYIEPALVHNLNRSMVTSLAVANKDRTRAVAPPGCSAITWPYATGGIYTAANCLCNHEVWFQPGYNCNITQDQNNNALVISASQGGGAGEPCGEVAMAINTGGGYETPPNGYPDDGLLEGGPSCADTLRTINGAAGPSVQFVAGQGVQISPDPSTNTVSIAVNMAGMVNCGGGGAT
jgi:hypothetical protein